MPDAAKRKRGRPPGSVSPDARRERVEVRVTEEERGRIEALAEARKLPVPEYVRRRLLSPRK